MSAPSPKTNMRPNTRSDIEILQKCIHCLLVKRGHEFYFWENPPDLSPVCRSCFSKNWWAFKSAEEWFALRARDDISFLEICTMVNSGHFSKEPAGKLVDAIAPDASVLTKQ